MGIILIDIIDVKGTQKIICKGFLRVWSGNGVKVNLMATPNGSGGQEM